MLIKLQKKLKTSYNSAHDDISKDFYNKVLEEAVSYKRVSGYFSCKALSLYADGLDKLYQNNGKLQLIISQNISGEDYEEIRIGYEARSNKEILTEEDKKKLGNLAYMIANKKADIKFGSIKNGLFHSKWGLFSDLEGNSIYFNGSMNETASGIEKNFDSFDVDFSWDISQNIRGRIKQKRIEFEELWNNKYENLHIIDASEIIYGLIERYDKGCIQEVTDSEENSIIFDMNNHFFFFIDKSRNCITKKKSFQSKFTYFIDNQKGYPYFHGDLTYIQVEKIIELARKQCVKNNCNFFVSEKVNKYIHSERYTIDEYRKSGLTLKSSDSRWKTEYQEFTKIINSEVERKFKVEQLKSAHYMLVQKRAANFSVPGSGKTAMLLGVYAYLNSKQKGQPINRILVICPINAFMSWIDEFSLVFGLKKELRPLNVHDKEVSGNVHAFENLWTAANLVLINYESLNKFQESIIKCLSEDSDTMIVYDEVHRIKGVEAKRAVAALEIADKVDYRYVLTGTPIPNSYLDIYNFLHILFKNEYSSFFGFDQLTLKDPSKSEINQINEKLSPYFWRTSKEDLGVPKAEPDHLILVAPSNEQLKLAEIIYTKTKNPLATWIRMLQLSTNPLLINQEINYYDLGYGEEDKFDGESYDQVSESVRIKLEKSIHEEAITEVKAWNLSNVNSPKFDKGIELVADLVKKHGKVVVWGLFVGTLKKITMELEDRGLKTKLIYGGTAKNEREEIIRSFNKQTEEIQVLVSNPNTLGESISLHHTAHHAVYFEYNYNLTFMLQSRDRIHRLGLKKDEETHYYYLMTVTDIERYNFIDCKVYNRLQKKYDRMKEAIDGDYLIPEFIDEEIEEMKEIIKSERKF